MAKISLDRFQLQFISHQNEKMSYLDGIHEAITGLCGWVQLRMKDASDDEVRPIAYKVKEWCKIMNVTFIIDDRVELVKEVAQMACIWARTICRFPRGSQDPGR